MAASGPAFVPGRSRSGVDALEVIGVLTRALQIIQFDLEALACEEGQTLIPDEILEALQEHIALKATMKHALQLAPEHADALRAFYREQHVMLTVAPVELKVLPETLEHLGAMHEYMRRQRLFDSRLDAACRNQGVE